MDGFYLHDLPANPTAPPTAAPPSLKAAPINHHAGAAVTCVRYSASGAHLASGGADGTVALSERDGSLFLMLQPATRRRDAAQPATSAVRTSSAATPAPAAAAAASAVLSLTWSPASRYLAAGSADALVRVYDLHKREQALTLRGHRAAVVALGWSSSEVHLASASAAGEVLVHRVQGSVAAVSRAQVAANGVAAAGLHWSPFYPMKLATGADDGIVALWDMTPPRAVAGSAPAAATCQHRFDMHTAACRGVQWSAVNHHLLASAGADGAILFYDVTRLLVVRAIRCATPLASFAFSAALLVAGTQRGELLGYDLRSSSSEPAWSIEAHRSAVCALALRGGSAPEEQRAGRHAGAPASSPRLAAQPKVPASPAKVPPSPAAAAVAARGDRASAAAADAAGTLADDGVQSEPGGTAGLGAAATSTAVLAALEGPLIELRAAVRDEVLAIHVDLIRELEAQRQEMRHLFEQSRAETAALFAENARLREEVASLRAPLGALGLTR